MHEIKNITITPEILELIADIVGGWRRRTEWSETPSTPTFVDLPAQPT
jgi:hypothetical protein